MTDESLLSSRKRTSPTMTRTIDLQTQPRRSTGTHPAVQETAPLTLKVRRRVPRELFGECPSCSNTGWFRFAGRQKWSEAVMQRTGQPSAINLWTCPHCGTTLTEARIRT